MKRAFGLAAALAFAVGYAWSQVAPAPERSPQDVVVEHRQMVVTPPTAGVRVPGPVVAHDTFQFIGAEMGVIGQVVKGAPFQAEAVTETVQALADGNRITRKSTSALARDSEGRTRREESLPALGPWIANGEASRMIFIKDPVASVSYMLNEQDKIAHKLPTARDVQVRHAGPGAVLPAQPPGGAIQIVRRREGPAVTHLRREPKVEPLGQRNIEGVVADGTRTTLVIPAGEIGNERALDIVSERWYSPELQVVVMSKHNDPRFGETTHRLTKITRSEPPQGLFEVPPDYKLEEGHGPVDVRIERRK